MKLNCFIVSLQHILNFLINVPSVDISHINNTHPHLFSPTMPPNVKSRYYTFFKSDHTKDICVFRGLITHSSHFLEAHSCSSCPPHCTCRGFTIVRLATSCWRKKLSIKWIWISGVVISWSDLKRTKTLTLFVVLTARRRVFALGGMCGEELWARAPVSTNPDGWRKSSLHYFPSAPSVIAQTGNKSGSNSVLMGLCWSGSCFQLLSLLMLSFCAI